ncbi:NADPH-dependent oxidoreductase [Gulosibacter sediminis]|uniref:NADPH-dependent oxidoreductase n=1 Tax=Gulosibacter sediminis TaxID=1729695 RepID=UPI0024AD27E8|nr:NADPH-dependent oxidoreductase [Gulosibacter sediminis]
MTTANTTRTTEQLVSERYRADLDSPVADGTETIDLQLAHRSVREFLPGEISDAQLRLIVAAAQSGSVSSNLQTWSIIAIRDEARKRRVSEAIGGRSYVEHAAVFLVWVADYHRAVQIAQQRGSEVETVKYLENTLVSFVDAGISGQNALLAAESLGLGGVFVGSIRNNPPGVVEELGLPEHVFPIVGLAIGVPDPDEAASTKPRLPQSAVLHEETYDADAWSDASAEYETRLADYFANYDKPDYSWARTLERRIGNVKGLYGRERMRDWLGEQGLTSQ